MIRVFGILVIALAFSRFTVPAAGEGAISIGEPASIARGGLAIGYSWNKTSIEDATEGSLKECRGFQDAPVATRNLCKLARTFNRECLTIALDPKAGTPGFGWAVSANPASGAQSALQKCIATAGAARRDFCKITEFVCDGDIATPADLDQVIVLAPDVQRAYMMRALARRNSLDFNGAIADYNRAAELRPGEWDIYSNRGWTYYGNGEFARASKDLQRAIELKDTSYAMIFRYLARTRLGEDAASELEANAGRLPSKGWPYAVIELYLEKRPADATLAAASSSDQQCEANFYIGEWHVLKKRPTVAEDFLRKAIESCPRTFIEYALAQSELKRLGQ